MIFERIHEGDRHIPPFSFPLSCTEILGITTYILRSTHVADVVPLTIQLTSTLSQFVMFVPGVG